MNKYVWMGAIVGPFALLGATPLAAQDARSSDYNAGYNAGYNYESDDSADDYAGADYAGDNYASDDYAGDDAEMREAQGDMVRRMNDPAFQDGVADMMGGMVKAVMAMKVGPVIDAANKMDPRGRHRRVRPDATVGDMVARGDPHVADRVAHQSRAATRSMGAMASGMARMMPVMVEMARDMGAQMEKSMGREMRKIDRDMRRPVD